MGQSGSTLTDKSGNGNTGNLIGPTYGRLPNGAYARSFDGVNDYVQAGNGPSLNPTGGLTIEALIYVNDSTKLQTLVGKSWSGPSDSGYTLRLTGSGPQLIVYDRNGNKQNIFGGQALPAGRWYHVVGTCDGSTMSLYVNGAKVASGPINGMKASSLGLTVGKYAPTSAEYFAGRMETVRVYNRALTAQEIKNNYNIDSAKVGLPALASVPQGTSSGLLAAALASLKLVAGTASCL